MVTRLQPWTRGHTAVLRAWQRHGASAAGTRINALYDALCSYPAEQQQWWRRRCKATLWGVALCLAASGVTPTQAATITVNGTTCTLVNAITAANTDMATEGCSAGSGADSIILTVDTTLTTSVVNFSGDTGLPVVSSAITIVGNGHSITRAAGAPPFRLLAINETGDLTIQDTTLSGGRLSGANERGGAIYNGSGQLRLAGCVVSENSAGFGGGLFTLTNGSDVVRLVNSTVSNNSASVGGGLQIRTFNSSTVWVANSTVSGNSANFVGGGVYSLTGDNSSVWVANNTISGNSAGGTGGGLALRPFGSGAVRIENSTINGNTAGSGGGLFSATYGTSTVQVESSTISGNSVGSTGGGLWLRPHDSSTMAVRRSLVAGNASTSSGDEILQINLGGTLAINASNLFGHSGLTTADALYGVSAGATDLLATSDSTSPTALAAILATTLANNGGPTFTHNLVMGSLAIDAAEACPLPDDQRGAPRPFDGDGVGGAACDIGAVEFGSPVDPCARAVATLGCKVNNVSSQPCEGTSGNDKITGTAGDDVIFGGAGNDKIKGGNGNDLLCGEEGNDHLSGGKGNDILLGGLGTDTLKGDDGNDALDGGPEDDKLLGGPGDDDLVGGEGIDTLKGNGGVDSCDGENESSCEL